MNSAQLKLLRTRIRLTNCRLRFIMDKWEEGKHKRDRKGQFAEMNESRKGTVGTGKGAVEVQLGFDGVEKPRFYPTTATKGHDRHHQDHADEMGLTLKQWKQQAAKLLNAVAEEDFIDWYIPDDETFNRFNKRNSVLAVGSSEGAIHTYFILQKSKYKFFIPNEYIGGV